MDNFNILKPKYKFKAIFSKRLREHIENCGVCLNCKKPNTERAWCKKCSPGRFLTSGNREIDNIIYEAQCKTRNYDENLEWIPYDRFENIKLIGEGGFAKIYSATWLDGEPKFNRKRSRICPTTVALKKLKPPTEAIIDEIKIHSDCSSCITKFYGITKDPVTEEFMMVLEYATFGNLREYLKNYYSKLKWKEKLEILRNIIDNLEFIHNRNYIHKDLHSGNILQLRLYNTKITDMGFAQLIENSKTSNSSRFCGVLPYIAPEVLDGKEYTFGSDIYSFGIIMTEVSTGKPPYGSVPHDGELALAICNGLRPSVSRGTPECYIDLLNQCLDANPKERPSAKKLFEIIYNWLKDYYHNEFVKADEPDKETIFLTTKLNPKAIYTSRSMCFDNLPEPRNSTKVQIENPEVSDSDLIELHISDEFQKLLEQNPGGFNLDSILKVGG